MVPPIFNLRRTVSLVGVQGFKHGRSSSSQKPRMTMRKLTSYTRMSSTVILHYGHKKRGRYRG